MLKGTKIKNPVKKNMDKFHKPQTHQDKRKKEEEDRYKKEVQEHNKF